MTDAGHWQVPTGGWSCHRLPHRAWRQVYTVVDGVRHNADRHPVRRAVRRNQITRGVADAPADEVTRLEAADEKLVFEIRHPDTMSVSAEAQSYPGLAHELVVLLKGDQDASKVCRRVLARLKNDTGNSSRKEWGDVRAKLKGWAQEYNCH